MRRFYGQFQKLSNTKDLWELTLFNWESSGVCVYMDSVEDKIGDETEGVGLCGMVGSLTSVSASLGKSPKATL